MVIDSDSQACEILWVCQSSDMSTRKPEKWQSRLQYVAQRGFNAKINNKCVIS